MFCRHCGKEIAGDSKFCPGCGGSALEPPKSKAPPTQQESVAAPQVILDDAKPMVPVIDAPSEDKPSLLADEAKRAGIFAALTTPIIAVIIVLILILTAVPTGWYFGSYAKDSDDDGVPDRLDAFPIDSGETKDSDDDGWGDNEDVFPLDPTSWSDPDGDGHGEGTDKFPQNPKEWSDSDNDGHGDNSDIFPQDSSEWADSDGDGHGDNGDAFPHDPKEWSDRDGDGHGDNSDIFPDNSNEWIDSDGDGHGDNGDAFPQDPKEWSDRDGDGHGDNSDLFPDDADEWKDNDGDGQGDNADPDDDNDGVLDGQDLFPYKNAKIRLYIDEFTLLDPIDTGMDGDPKYGNIWITINIVNSENFRIPTSSTHKCEINIAWTVGKEMLVDVPDSTAEWKIDIQAWDEDGWSSDDQVDLSPTSSRTLHLTFNIQTGVLSGDVTTGVGDGSDDGTASSDDDDGKITFNLTVIF